MCELPFETVALGCCVVRFVERMKYFVFCIQAAEKKVVSFESRVVKK